MNTKNLIKIILIFLVVSFFILQGYGQQKDIVKDVTERVKILEGQKDNLNKLAELLKNDFEAKKKQLDTKFILKAEELTLIAEEIKRKQKLNNWIIGFLAFIGAGSIVGFFLWIKKFVGKKAKEYAEKLIEEALQKEKQNILESAKRQGEEFQLKEKKSILVVSLNDDSSPFMKDFFQEMGFSHVSYENIDKTTKLNSSDMVLFNNEAENLKHGDILNIIKETKKEIICFYFGPDRFDSGEFKNKVSFANARVQLYGNLINALRYQALL